jgi:hypothetical protein
VVTANVFTVAALAGGSIVRIATTRQKSLWHAFAPFSTGNLGKISKERGNCRGEKFGYVLGDRDRSAI